jgi:hypothetical protein
MMASHVPVRSSRRFGIVLAIKHEPVSFEDPTNLRAGQCP